MKKTTYRYRGYFDGGAENGKSCAYAWIVARRAAGQVEFHAVAYKCRNITPKSAPLTNNVAEYAGAISLMKWLLSKGIKDVEIYGDSMLVIKQISGEFRVRTPHLVQFSRKAKELFKQFEKIEIDHIPRRANAMADLLCNRALEKGAGYSESNVSGEFNDNGSSEEKADQKA